MRKTTLRRLEALEKEERCRQQQERSRKQKDELAFLGARWSLWEIVLAHYLGGLTSSHELLPNGMLSDEPLWPDEGLERVLKYPVDGLFEALRNKDPELIERFGDAYRRLFAKVGLDFDTSPASVLFDAFVTMVNQLPDHWLNWLRSQLREHYSDAEIAAGSNLPRRLSGDNFLIFWGHDRALA
jgi:hypothetical protein